MQRLKKSDFKSYLEEYLLRAGYVARVVLIIHGSVGWVPGSAVQPHIEKNVELSVMKEKM